MDFKEVVEKRRSVRKYSDQPIAKETLEEIVRLSSCSPSWKNTQCVSYIIVENPELKEQIAKECVCGFEFNTKTISRAKALAVLTIKKGLSGCEEDGSFSTTKGDSWEMFDAGVAAQTFCLAAKAEGVGTVILGIIDEAKTAEILGLAEDEAVAAFIAMGYPEKEGKMPPRKAVTELLSIR
jgi:nitroreductase